MTANRVLEAKSISKYFYNASTTQVLDQVSVQVNRGEFVTIMGKSGCGKSTLLYILSTMDTDYEGQLWLDGTLVTGKDSTYLSQLRNEKIGFVFQFHYLLNEFTVLENVMIPALKLAKHSRAEIAERAMEKLRIFDMQDHAHKQPNQLSGGQKQRVSIARALINDPLLIMGDEPTGNLDHKNSALVLDKFKELTQELGQTLLIVTHDQEFAKATDRTIEMEDGKVVEKVSRQ
jgi:lipoprotein-releasing system ATP-binding protein